MTATTPAIDALAECEATIAELQAERNAAENEATYKRANTRLTRTMNERARLAELAEAEALAALQAEYRALCQDAARAAIARARAKARRDRAAAFYYKAHAAYLAADAVATALERQVTFGFAMKLPADVRTALAGDMRAARAAAGLQTTPTPERHYAAAQ